MFAAQDASRVHGAVLGPEAFILRFQGPSDDDRLLLVNFGRQLALAPLTEPLMVPPRGCQWQLLWSSEDPLYGGLGSGATLGLGDILHPHAALVFKSAPLETTREPNS